MNFYKNPSTGEVFAFEADGSQDAYILPDLVPMTPGEVLVHLNPPPTADQVLAEARFKLDTLLGEADVSKAALASRISTLQDAIELGMATEAEVSELPLCEWQLTEWKRYRVFLGRVTSQPGFPAAIDWPIKPA